HQQTGHMIASDPIRALHHLLRAGGRPHMDCPVKPGNDTDRVDRVNSYVKRAYVSANGATLIGANLRLDGAANSSPPPFGEGSGVGVGRCGTSVPHGTTPHPNPPPQGGEGVRAAKLAPMGATLVVAPIAGGRCASRATTRSPIQRARWMMCACAPLQRHGF